MSIVRGIVKDVNEADVIITLETLEGEMISVFVKSLDYEAGDPLLVVGDLNSGVITNPDVIIKYPSEKLLRTDAKINDKLWNFYKKLVDEYNQTDLAKIMLKHANTKSGNEDEEKEGGDE